jgi:YfiH family protein
MAERFCNMNIQNLENGLQVSIPCWDVPAYVHAFVTTRNKGFSASPFDTLNLGLHVGDRIEDVIKNRSLIRQVLPDEPIWLNQVHGTSIWTSNSSNYDADGALTNDTLKVLTIMTADCMPVLFCDQFGDITAACHAGWRGLAFGVLQATIKEMLVIKGADSPSTYISNIKVYLGPTIGPSHFEVGEEVFRLFPQS